MVIGFEDIDFKPLNNVFGDTIALLGFLSVLLFELTANAVAF